MMKVLRGGIFTTVQDYPGRLGYWHIGVPPSGAMDTLSFRIANGLVGNLPEAAGLEMTFDGADIEFQKDSIIALTGGDFVFEIDGKTAPLWQAVSIKAGQQISIGKSVGPGARTYLAVQGGIDVPEYLGSRSTFPQGKLGGVNGRKIQSGDQLPLQIENPAIDKIRTPPKGLVPEISGTWFVDATLGPYEAPDYFTYQDVEQFYATTFTVSHNASRLGYRLESDLQPQFARKSGGGGGSHPSNVHDYVYALGSVNFTGNTPIIIGPDGPSLGGFVCMVTVPSYDLWKVGQAKPGDQFKFEKTSARRAVARLKKQEKRFARWFA